MLPIFHTFLWWPFRLCKSRCQTVRNAAHFLREFFGGQFSLAIFNVKQGKMLPISLREFFSSRLHLGSFGRPTGRDAAHFSARILVAGSPWQFSMSNRAKVLPIFWENFLWRFETVDVKQGEMLPIFLRDFIGGRCFFAISNAFLWSLWGSTLATSGVKQGETLPILWESFGRPVLLGNFRCVARFFWGASWGAFYLGVFLDAKQGEMLPIFCVRIVCSLLQFSMSCRANCCPFVAASPSQFSMSNRGKCCPVCCKNLVEAGPHFSATISLADSPCYSLM